MKRILFLILVIFLLMVQASIGCELTVRVPMGNTYPPFFMQDPDGRWNGLAIELAEALLKEAGCKAVYEPLPFPRSLAYMENGKIDMMLNLTITPEREKFIHFIGPQLDETVIFVTRKDAEIVLNSLEDFKKLPSAVGVERGKVYGKAFEEKRAADPEFAKKFEEVTEVHLNEAKLENRRISGFLGYGYNVFYRMKSNPAYDQFSVNPFIINQDWVYFGFSKTSVPPDRLRQLQDGFDRAQKQGLFQNIRMKYMSH